MNGELANGKKFLGVGITFPFHLDGQGHVALNHLEEQVRQSILLILQTAPGERVMRPEFGAGLSRLVFMPASSVTAALAQQTVKDALTRFEPRIDVLNVSAIADPTEPNKLKIDLQYRIRQTDAVFNLVYPFYLDRGEV